MDGTAHFSPDPARTYRYTLTRRWAPGPAAMFIMLNPSTADAETMDPTVARCYRFARAWGYNALNVGNAYALRSTDPRALLSARYPEGNPTNDRELRRLIRLSDLVVVAWGNHITWKRSQEVLTLINKCGKAAHALTLTKAGHPGHPLYLRGDLRPVPLTLLQSV